MVGNPVARPTLIDFASNITKGHSLLVCGHIVITQDEETIGSQLVQLQKHIEVSLLEQKVRAFYDPVIAKSLRKGVHMLLQVI